VGRKPTKNLKPGEQVHLSFTIDSDIVLAADKEAVRLRKEHDIAVTRTDVLRRWLRRQVEAQQTIEMVETVSGRDEAEEPADTYVAPTKHKRSK
jgi:hypothetical protein